MYNIHNLYQDLPVYFLMLSRRMTPSSAVYASSINSVNNEVGDEETTINPMQNTGPSNAYMESLRKAQASERGNANITYVKVPGCKTIAVALFLFVGGLVLFIIGAIFYWNTSDWSTLKVRKQSKYKKTWQTDRIRRCELNPLERWCASPLFIA